MPHPRRALALGALAAALLATAAAPASGQAPEADDDVLLGRAVLGARTFADGPPSGAAITGNTNGVPVPFPSQPVQGLSAVVRAEGGGFWAMPDNGFGSEATSKDFLLRVYRIFPDFRTARGGSGTIAVGQYIQLSDPDGKVPFALEREDRLLTGGDFDIESFRIDARGDLWFGDEFGPYVLHADASGRLLEAPIALPDVRSPDNPPLGAADPSANLGRSRGFEGMALDRDGFTLYPMLEGAVAGDDPSRRRIYRLDVNTGAYAPEIRASYRVEAPDNAIGDFTAFGRYRYLVIERDNLQGPAAAFKKVYLVDLRRTDEAGNLVKREILDLLDIRDPAGLSLTGAREGDFGLGDPFRFPFQTIESVLPLGGERLLLLNDNNFPFSAGRNAGRPDDNEAIVVRVPEL